MKILKTVGIIFFTLIIIVKFYLTYFKSVPLDKTSIAVLVCFIFVLLNKTKIFWIIGIGISILGVYTLIFISNKVAEPTAMEFTSSLNYFFFGTHSGSFLRYIISLIPNVFYLTAILFLLSKKGRVEYQIQPQKK